MARRSCRPVAMNFRNRKSARAAFWCTALIAVITAVSQVHSELSDSTRRDTPRDHEECAGIFSSSQLHAIQKLSRTKVRSSE